MKGAVPSLGLGGDLAPNGGVEVPRDLVHEWGKNRVGGGQADLCTNCLHPSVMVKRELSRKVPRSYPHLWS